MKVVLLGSSPLLVQKGLTESLAGRFEVIPVTHWSYPETKEAFGWSLEQYVFFGGYPGSAGFIEEQERWARYIIDSLIETTLSRHILLLTRVIVFSPYSLASARRDREYWGRLVESAVGAHLINSTRGEKNEVFYWLERNQEVDFVIRSRKDLVCLEIKSSRMRQHLSGMSAFTKAHRPKRHLLVGQEGIPLEDSLMSPLERWLA